ncbi:MAG: hypothetical protein HZA52_13050 [Planctomycetes bacterium]|nr:hypothetical protein [Planctomycetota bacterium]
MASQQPAPPSDGRGALNWILLVARSLACTLEVFLHNPSTFGARYLQLQSLVGVGLIFFFPVFFEREDPRPMFVYAGVFFFACCVIRAKASLRRARGAPEEHSYYNGTPSLMRLFRSSSEMHVKGAVEPVLVALLGFALTEWNHPLGCYLVIAAVGLMLSVRASQRVDRARALDMNDAFHDQRRISAQWRRMRRD